MKTDGSYNGLSWGSGTQLAASNLKGVDGPPIRHAVPSRQGADGAYLDASFLGPRVFSLTLEALPGQDISDIEAALNAAFSPSQAELPFVLNGKTIGAVLSGGPDLTRESGWISRHLVADIELTATDPRWYDAPRTQSTGLFSASGGMGFPFGFPLGFGIGTDASSGLITVENSGSLPTGLLLRITGPASNPVVADVQSGDSLAIRQVLNAGDVIEIDTLQRTLLLNGAPRRDLASFGSRYFLVPAKSTHQIRFQADAASSGASLALTYAPAYLSVGG